MPSHVHLIISSGENLGAIMRDFKKLTSKRIVEAVGITNESRKEWLLRTFGKAGLHLKRIRHNKLWQDGNHPILLDSIEMVR